MATSGNVEVALITAGSTLLGAFGIEWLRSSLRARSARRGRIREACIDLITRVNRYANRVDAMRRQIHVRSGLKEGFNVMMRHVTVPDALDVSDYLYAELDAVHDARAAIWLNGDRQLIKAADDVLAAAASLTRVGLSIPSTKGATATETIANNARRFAVGLEQPAEGSPEAFAYYTAQVDLAKACAAFGTVARRRAGVRDSQAIELALPGFQPDQLRDADT